MVAIGALLVGWACGLVFIGMATRVGDPSWRASELSRWGWLLSRKFWTLRRPKSPWSLILAGAAVIIVPGAYAVFPELTHRPLWSRGVVAGCVVLLALIVVLQATTRDFELTVFLTEHRVNRATGERVVAAVLPRLLSPGAAGAPRSFRFTAFMPTSGRLHPVYPVRIDDPEDPKVFAFGQGAVGRAFQFNRIEAATGEAVSNEEYGLSERQRRTFQANQAVVGVPLRAGGQVIGALGAISREYSTYFLDEDHARELLDLADVVAVLMLLV